MNAALIALLPYVGFFVLLLTLNSVVLHFRTPPEKRRKTQGSFLVNLLAVVALVAIAAVGGTWLGNHTH